MTAPPDSKSLADDVFDTMNALSRAEDRLAVVLQEIYADWDDPRYDSYDSSIEIYNCTPTSSLERLAAAGFDRVWQHPHPQGEPGNCECRCEVLATSEDGNRVIIDAAPARVDTHPVSDDFNLDDLDPGIRETVRRLRSAGFETTDSGDGVTKPADDGVIPHSHVVICSTPDAFIAETRRLRDYLRNHGIQVAALAPEGAGVSIQASYDPADESVVIMLCGVNDTAWPGAAT